MLKLAPLQLSADTDLSPWLEKASALLPACLAGESEYADSQGWLNIDTWAGEETLSRLESLAQTIRQRDEVFVLIGVGGSNNAARAVIEALSEGNGPQVIYAGNSLSAHAMNQVLAAVKDKEFSINVIAKNFETLEPGLAFRMLRQELARRYGDGAKERIIATGTIGTSFERLCTEQGYAFLSFATDIGGRFTALSAVGLLPMAVAGIDIRTVVSGAKSMRQTLEEKTGAENPAIQYAALRNCFYSEDYRIELLASFEPRFRYFYKWWVQLFGESEGKEAKGIFPVAAEYSEDLHSMGQFVQEGTPLIFETILDITADPHSCLVTADGMTDYFDYVDGKDLREINRAALEATVQAHNSVLPVLRIELEQLDAAAFGALFYFFQFACYLSGRVLGVNPFNQPGVEAYKGWMFQRLGK